MNAETPCPAASLTRSGSKQSYYTIKFLVDRERVEDAYRAYGYFRWVDDTLDAGAGLLGASETSERIAFLERQRQLLDGCLRGEQPQSVCPQERMLVELARSDQSRNSGLRLYLQNMMLMMDFDVRRRGRLISQGELSEYTRWLAVAVTECIHYFIGHAAYAPRDGTRYLAVSAAHIIHMLRDTFDDLRCGYINIPQEVLQANHITPEEVGSPAYRQWVKGRVELARRYFQAGKSYFWRSQCLRHRLAGLAYIARFEWLLEKIEQEGYLLRPAYNERKSLATGLKMGWGTLVSMLGWHPAVALRQPVASRRQDKV